MEWRDELKEALPSPRRDEPASLRRDIEDELADHLHCAMAREGATATDETQARRAVLERFGNPRRVAYKLWWDAMKEKIMKDRLLAAASILLMLTCAVALAALWLTLKENREVNAALLAQLKAIASAPAPIPAGMAVFKLKAAQGTPEGKPASELLFILIGSPFKDSQEETLKLVTDAEGNASCGPIRPGTYQLKYQGVYNMDKSITLFAGQTLQTTLVTPTDLEPPQVETNLSADIPTDLAQVIGLSAMAAGEVFLVGGTLVRDASKAEDSPWRGGVIKFFANNQGEFTVLSSDSVMKLHFNEVSERFKYENESYKKTLSLPTGRYRLIQIFYAKGKTINNALNMRYGVDLPPNEQLPVEIGNSGVVHIPLPVSFKQALLDIYSTERTFEVTRQSSYFRFHDVAFLISTQVFKGISGSKGDYIGLQYNSMADVGNGLKRTDLSQGKPLTIGETEFLFEKVNLVRGEQIPIVRVRYIPGSAAAPQPPSAQSPKALHEAPTTHTQPALRR